MIRLILQRAWETSQYVLLCKVVNERFTSVITCTVVDYHNAACVLRTIGLTF